MFQVNTQGNTHNAMTTSTPHDQINHCERERERERERGERKKFIKKKKR